MRNKIKAIIPESVLKERKYLLQKRNLEELYKFDKERYQKSAYNMKKNFNYENLRSKITFHYHSIEKGLSNIDFRKGFGKNAFSELFFSMDKYIDLGYPVDDSRFQQGISTIKTYVELHDKLKFDVPEVKRKLEQYQGYLIDEYSDSGGATEISKSELPDYEKSNFKELAINRHSIRDFGSEPIEELDIFESIEIATKTPSVCNRQAHKVYYIKDSEKLELAYKLQGGLTTHGDYLQGLLLVTTNREYMNGPHERNQTYIDGGMFAMSLVYSLTYKNIASCTLNTDFSLQKEKEVRNLLDISEAEDLIAFIAMGSFPETVKFAKSPRDKGKDITKII